MNGYLMLYFCVLWGIEIVFGENSPLFGELKSNHANSQLFNLKKHQENIPYLAKICLYLAN